MVTCDSLNASAMPGDDVISIVASILQSLPLSSVVRLAEVDIPPIVQDRIAPLDQLKPIMSSTLKLREEYGIPFWMALMFIAERTGVQLPQELLHASAFHQPMTAAKTEHWPAAEVSETFLRDRSAKTQPDKILVISSKVHLNNDSIAHIPMLDFRIASSQDTLPTAEAVIRELQVDGWLLDSGRSYHFYGQHLLSSEQFIDFLARALFFTPIIDYRWVAHQLRERAAALRLSTGTGLQKLPTLVSNVRLR